MVLVSKWINNQWNINKICRITPYHVIRYDIYGVISFFLSFNKSNAILINKIRKCQTNFKKS